jgi:hypothetical protein
MHFDYVFMSAKSSHVLPYDRIFFMYLGRERADYILRPVRQCKAIKTAKWF